MKAQDIIDRLKDQTDDLRSMIDALQDGEYLSKEGYTEGDQEIIEEAHYILKTKLKESV